MFVSSNSLPAFFFTFLTHNFFILWLCLRFRFFVSKIDWFWLLSWTCESIICVVFNHENWLWSSQSEESEIDLLILMKLLIKNTWMCEELLKEHILIRNCFEKLSICCLLTEELKVKTKSPNCCSWFNLYTRFTELYNWIIIVWFWDLVCWFEIEIWLFVWEDDFDCWWNEAMKNICR